MPTVLEQLKAARRVSVPIVAIQSSDLNATANNLNAELNGFPRIQWDCVRGPTAMNDLGIAALGSMDMDQCFDLTGCLSQATNLPPDTMLFIHNAHRFLDRVDVMQALLNLRDRFKSNGRMCVLLGCQITLPIEIRGDVLQIDEPLPHGEQVASIINGVHSDAGLECSEDTLGRAAAAVRGLNAFQIDQNTALNLLKDGLNVDGLWESKRKQIRQTLGLSIVERRTTFADIGGIEQWKDDAYRAATGRRKATCIVSLEEGEKMFAGLNDMTGISKDFIGVLLDYMEERKQRGLVSIGHPGSSKSLSARSLGFECGIPTIRFDCGAMMGSLVGESQQAIRAAIRIIDAISGGDGIWVMTVNGIDGMPPEFLARFNLGSYFFSLPNYEERQQIWSIQQSAYGLQDDDSCDEIDDEGWVGRDIRNCCDKAWNLGISLFDASRRIVPLIVNGKKEIEEREIKADGRYLDASKPGIFRRAIKGDVPARRIAL